MTNPDTSALMPPQIHDDAESFVVDEFHGFIELDAAVAAQRTKDVARETFRVDTGEYRFAITDVAHGQRHMLLASHFLFKAVDGEFTPGGGKAG